MLTLVFLFTILSSINSRSMLAFHTPWSFHITYHYAYIKGFFFLLMGWALMNHGWVGVGVCGRRSWVVIYNYKFPVHDGLPHSKVLHCCLVAANVHFSVLLEVRAGLPHLLIPMLQWLKNHLWNNLLTSDALSGKPIPSLVSLGYTVQRLVLF